MRVIDADTFEVYIRRNQVGVGVIGVRSPMANTECGRQATRFLQGLLNGPIRLEEDPSIIFDSRKRRMYYVKKNGRSVAEQLVTAGLARADGAGIEAPGLARAEADARAAGRGCVANPAANVPIDPGNPDLPPVAGPRGGRDTSAANRQTTMKVADSSTSESILAAAADGSPSAANVTNGFTLETVVGGLNTPTAFTFLPDGRILVATKSGVVRLIKNGVLQTTPFIDISSKVNAYWDHGLLGIAADPAFASNGYVYLLYVYENNAADYSGTKTARLTRVTASGDTASPASETVILGKNVGASCKDFPAGADCIPSEAPSHSIGNIKFSADGTMFVTAGDATTFNLVDDDALRAQDLDSLAGKILRITTTGAGVSTNPFWNGSADANRSKVWGLGVRNSYRFAIRSSDRVPFVGDVGWSSYEEINIMPAGANAGWPCYEGRYRQSGYEPKAVCQALYSQGAGAVRLPLVDWDHTQGGAASTAGTFYTGTSFPSVFQGAFIYADYAQGWMRSINVDGAGNITRGPIDIMTGGAAPVNIEQGADGNLYYLDINTGELKRLRYIAASDAPLSILSTAPASNATNVVANTEINVIFSEPVDVRTLGIDPSTQASTAFTVRKQGATAPIAAIAIYDNANATLTLRPSAELELGATYTAIVKGGTSGVKDLTGNALPSDTVWTFTVSASPPANTIRYLGDLPWTSATNGFGPVERNTSNGDSAAGDGQPIKLNNGRTYLKGLGVHAFSDVRFNLGGSCTSFMADVGIDAETGPNGTVVFQVFGDGVKLYDSGLQATWTPAANVNVDITGKKELGLVVTDYGDGANFDHADWADARISCASDTAAPIVTNTQPVNGATGVAANTTVTATFSKAMNGATITPSTFTLTQQGGTTPVQAAVQYNASTSTATLTPSAALQIGVTYTATVKGGTGGVTDISGIPLQVDKTWTFTTSAVATTTQYLSDMTWTSASNGWGPVEKDKSNGEDAAGDGRTISLGGKLYAKGLGAHAASDIRYNLNGACTSFVSDVGIDDEVRPNGSVVFQVYGDGTKLYDSGLVLASTAVQSLRVDVTGKSELRLVITDAGDGNAFDHADWAGASVTCNSGASTKPVASITSPSPTLKWKVGDTITYAGSAKDSSGNTIPPSGLAWNILLHHCPDGTCHTHPFTTATGSGGSFVAPDHGDESYFELVLTATDSTGQTGTASVSIYPRTAQITLNTSPPGLQVVYGGVSGAAPFTHTSIVGSAVTIYAPSPQGTATFTSWSDGGAQQHNIVVGATNATYTATFAAGGGATTPPAVTGTQPANGATGVAVNTAVTATFSEAMSAASITASTFTLTPQGGATAVPATVQYNGTNVTATLTPSSTLQAGTTYIATVKGGTSGVKDAAGNPLAADFTWTFSTGSGATTTRYLSDLAWTSAVNGWGPVERDMSNGEDAAGDGRTITLAGTTYAKGLGAHAASDIRFNLGGACTSFVADVGIDDEVRPNGSVVFQVYADGAKLYDSGVVNAFTATQSVRADVTGKNELQLVITDAGDGNGYDHADWAGAAVTCR